MECWPVEAALPPNRQPLPHEEGGFPAGSMLLELWASYRTPAEAVRCWSGDLGWLLVSRRDSDLEKNMHPVLGTAEHALENSLQEESLWNSIHSWTCLWNGAWDQQREKEIQEMGILDMNILKEKKRKDSKAKPKIMKRFKGLSNGFPWEPVSQHRLWSTSGYLVFVHNVLAEEVRPGWPMHGTDIYEIRILFWQVPSTCWESHLVCLALVSSFSKKCVKWSSHVPYGLSLYLSSMTWGMHLVLESSSCITK